MLTPVWVGVLGPTVVAADRDGEPIDVRATKQRALLAALALDAPRPVSPDAVIEAIWGPDAPPTAAATLQTYVSVVRRLLEPDLAARTPSSYLVSVDGGYRLVAETDAAELAATVNEVHAALGRLSNDLVPVANGTVDPDRLAERLSGALAGWRGEPYADLPDSDLVRPERARLDALRVLAQEDRATLLVAAGRDAEAVAELQSLCRAHPLRERPWLLLAAALARSGRQADALAALDDLRATLDTELGLEPSGQVNELQTMILRHEVPQPRRQGTAPAGPQAPETARVTLPAWPLVGRDQHLATLEALLERVERAEPEFASLVGEPGAGKSRLAAELAVRAQERDVLVLVGRCSQDEDAPPLWPWRQALGDAVVDQPGADLDTDHDAARFAVAESVRRALAELTRERTVLLALEDLHWADPSSLRVLRHVTAHLETGRLLVVATWRRGSTSAPGGQALADVAEALARRHATTLEVAGLDEDETALLVAELTGDRDRVVAGALHRRTDGNPFFLIESGRLARDEGRALGEAIDGVPPTVAAVVTRRIAQLPTPTSAALTAGAVIGREFSVDLLARALESEELALLDLLQPAVDGDLLRDVGGDVFRFGHALARDAAYGALTPSRRERLHALIAGMVEESADETARAPEVARHWAAAGPRHVRRAWRAAARAGDLAMTAHAADEAAAHFESALALHAQDPAGTERERYDLLVEYAGACRWSTRRLEMHGASDAATLIAGRLGDPELVVRAAAVPTEDALWPARSYGDANEEVVGVLRETLAALPVEDSPLRCRLLLTLASESYYVARPGETDRLVDEAVSMARRLGESAGEQRLLADSLLGAVVAWWRPDRADERQALLAECLRLSEEHGFERLAANARCLLTCGRCELGDVDDLVEELAEMAELAREYRLHFAELIVTGLAHSWSVMAGDVPGAQAHTTRLAELDEQISLAHKQDALRGVAFNVPLWFRGVPIDLEQVGTFVHDSPLPLASGATALFLRHGLVEQAREVWAAHEFDEVTVNWYSPPYWAFSAEAAVGLGDHEVGAAVYARLRPFSGRCVMSGTNPALGPVDAYLALAAAATGETAIAGEHADRALEQARAWQVPQVEEWLLELRDRHAF
jgi:DNA-binding SARP family transcriptional activator